MATVFEIFMEHDEERYAAQAAEACFQLLTEIELELSRFKENSDIARIAALRMGEKTVLGSHAYACLEIGQKIAQATRGAFDIAYMSRKGNPPPKESPSNIPDLYRLDPDYNDLLSLTDSLILDLGGIGKGYALDSMAELLHQWGIERALLQGGQSSVLAMNAPQDQEGWELTVSHPDAKAGLLARISLVNRAMGASGVQKGAHIIKPASYSGRLESGVRAVWTIGLSAAEMDALSTAAMLMDEDLLIQYCAQSNHTVARFISDLTGKDGEKKKDQLLLFGAEQNLFAAV
jgi:thiamine biosynthesis lipoprotein